MIKGTSASRLHEELAWEELNVRKKKFNEQAFMFL
jgi:hypothetical protein